MKKYNPILFLLFPSIVWATDFFASNNTQTLDLQTAFNRLEGIEQRELREQTIQLLQKEHLQQGSFRDLLGTYKMSGAEVTADNSEKFSTSPYQKIPAIQVFKIAQRLARQLKQESVAVFIPAKKTGVGDTFVSLTSHSYSINETIKIISEHLPEQYQAFSLHIKSCTCTHFENAVVDSIEWLGSKVHAEEIGKAFPLEKISFRYGRAYLVYADGRQEHL